MKVSSNTQHSIAKQKGALLPVILLLGIGLMTGVAGVVNLGYVEADLAAAERVALDGDIAAQYLTDYQEFEGSRFTTTQTAKIPFPKTLSVGNYGATADSDNCFKSDSGQYQSTLGGLWGSHTADLPYTLDQIYPVNDGTISLPEITDSSVHYLTQYGGRDVHFLTIPSGANDRVELRQLGETDVDRFFAHIWFRLPALPRMGDGGDPNYGSIAVPLLTHSSATNAVPTMQWIVRASGIPMMPHLALNGSQTEDAVDMHLELVISSGVSGVTLPSPAVGRRSDRLEWHAASIWYDGPSNSIWSQIRHRGVLAASAGSQWASGPADITIDQGSDFYIGNREDLAHTGDFLNIGSGSFDISTVRVWLEPPFTTSASAAELADGLFKLDAYEPGARFVSSSTPVEFPFTLDEPNSYVTLDSDAALIALSGPGRLITSKWQPLFGQPFAMGSTAIGVSSPVRVGGNPDTLPSDILRHGGPPTSIQYYVQHSCNQADPSSYRFVDRERRYVRGAEDGDEKVFWSDQWGE